jgi:acyl-CoA synthetase (AMP-forming)/AMP-acid ligase II
VARAHAEAITVGDLLVRAAEQYPDRDAVVFPHARMSFAELLLEAGRVARGLIGLGVQRGEHVGVLMANDPECVATLLGISLAGMVMVPINTRYRAVELPYVVENADLVAVVTSDRIDHHVDLLGLLAEALQGLTDAPEPTALALAAAPALRTVVTLGERVTPGTVSEHAFFALAAEASSQELEIRRLGARVRDPALLLYTSGTTAQPRGCPLTHEAIVRTWRAVADILELTEQDRVWVPCPMFHLAAIGPMLACLSAGAALLSDTHFDAPRALALIERERASVLYPAYPPITQDLLGLPGYPSAELSGVRAMLNVAPPETLRQMQAAMPQARQVSLYGLTEAGGPATYTRLDDDEHVRMTTCGAPLPGVEVRVSSDEEILVRGFGLSDGYYKDPVKTAATFDAQGWLHTGDRGALDEHGHLRFLGRLKETLKVGGENVAPAEIEDVLATHPAVKLAQVVGIPDERLVEVPVAFVELRPGHDAGEEELIDYCRGLIASFKVPRHVRLVQEWPLSATKIQKQPLRERMLEELALHG